MHDDLLPLAEAIERTGAPAGWAARQLRLGIVPGEQIEGVWHIHRADLPELAARALARRRYMAARDRRRRMEREAAR